MLNELKRKGEEREAKKRKFLSLSLMIALLFTLGELKKKKNLLFQNPVLSNLSCPHGKYNK